MTLFAASLTAACATQAPSFDPIPKGVGYQTEGVFLRTECSLDMAWSQFVLQPSGVIDWQSKDSVRHTFKPYAPAAHQQWQDDSLWAKIVDAYEQGFGQDMTDVTDPESWTVHGCDRVLMVKVGDKSGRYVWVEATRLQETSDQAARDILAIIDGYVAKKLD